MPSLRQDFRNLKDILASKAPEIITKFSLEDSCVKLTARDKRGRALAINVVFTDAESYPHSAALVLGEDDQSSDVASSVGEKFSDAASLLSVVEQVLASSGHNIDLRDTNAAGCLYDEEIAGQHGGSTAASDGDAMSCGGDSEYDYEYEGSDDDRDGYSEGGDDGLEEDEDRDLMIDIGMRQSLWERVEQQKEALDEEESAKESLSAVQSAVAERQIFNTREAFQMLSRELSDLIRAQDPDLFVDAVDGNVYCWDVNMGGFDSASPLGQDLAECLKRHGFSMVQLRLSFMRGLHPFYPPSVEILRPHFQGPVLGVLAAHPLLQLADWDPWKPQSQVLQHLKLFLQNNARLDLEHPGNSSGGPSFSQVERMLARLDASSGVPSLRDPAYEALYKASAEYEVDVARKEALLQTNKRSRHAAASSSSATTPADAASAAGSASASTPNSKTFWKAGTGYGSGRGEGGPVWDAKAAEAAQRAQDRERKEVLRQLATALAQELGGSVGPLPCNYGHPLEQQVASATPALQTEAGRASVMYALQHSSLLPFATLQLGTASVGDMTQRAQYYCSLLEVLRQLARPACIELLQLRLKGRSAADCVAEMVSSARQFKKMTLTDREQRLRSAEARTQALQARQEAAASMSQASGSTAAVNTAAAQLMQRQLSVLQQQEAADNKREVEALLVAELLLDLSSRIRSCTAASTAAAGPSSSAAADGTRGPATEASTSGSSSSSAYLKALRPLQVQYLAGFPSGHSAGATARDTEGGAGSRLRMQRVLREAAGLERDLPLTESSSVFVAVSEEQATLWKALIVGPDDTPYAGGCFVFDIYFPPQYPQGPPQVQFKTTGGGSIRFNPNLYNCGKVCLSLLGTWSGGKGEGWNASASTALQVLISIQSLILVEHPYFNEPGYEQHINTPEGDIQSRNYNKAIREGAIKWGMIEYLKTPPPEFADVIRTHFRLRGRGICDMLEGWVREARAYDRAHAKRMEDMLAQLRGLVAQLH